MKPHYLHVDAQILALALMQRTDITRLDLAFSALVGYDFVMIEPWLPMFVDTVLDVGAGLAAIDVHLARAYPDAEFWLLDKSEFGNAKYGTETNNEFYSDNQTTQRFLAKNGLEPARTHFIEPGDKFPNSVDLCISLFSWGWHYPVGEYAQRVARAMRPEGLLVLDTRHDASELEGDFDFVRKFNLMDGERMFWRRK